MFASLRCLQWAPWAGYRCAIVIGIAVGNGKNTIAADTAVVAAVSVVQHRWDAHGLAHCILSTIIVASGEQGSQRADD